MRSRAHFRDRAAIHVDLRRVSCAVWARDERRRETEPIDGSASPRKPSVATDSRSSSEAILLVAWREMRERQFVRGNAARRRRGCGSARCRRARCRCRCGCAPASRLFSTSSLTTEAGPLDDLACGDLVDELAGENADRHARQYSGPQYNGVPSARAWCGVTALRMRSALATVARRRICAKRVPGGGFCFEVAADAGENGARPASSWWSTLFRRASSRGVRDVRRLHQHRRNIRRLQHDEAGLLHLRLAHFADAVERREHALAPPSCWR